MFSSIIEILLIVFGLIIALFSIFNLIDKDLAKDILTILSTILPIVYSFRRRRKFKELARFFHEKR
ncbi:MAG: hypothetical protein NZ929_06535 [Aigarchaeota archaeon]|nr:hypothetical protein [Aigarchaeota archaeon]MCX8192405.1 hypothetical protein [Nitrososphaeria archaeon]MDW7986611.1 hypothetical protein [Nitrososphaerota archaeon]